MCLPCLAAAGLVQEDGEADETDELVSQVLDEIGINLTGQVGGVCWCVGSAGAGLCAAV